MLVVHQERQRRVEAESDRLEGLATAATEASLPTLLSPRAVARRRRLQEAAVNLDLVPLWMVDPCVDPPGQEGDTEEEAQGEGGGEGGASVSEALSEASPPR